MHNLNSLLSSSYSSKLLFNNFLLFDFFDRFLFLNFRLLNGISVSLDLKLPFNNSLSKFKNKIYLILYFLVFESLFDIKPQVVPVFSSGGNVVNTKPITKNKSRSSVLGKKFNSELEVNVSFFRLSASPLPADFLTLLAVFVSKNTYKDLVVLSRFVKLNLKSTKKKKISSFFFKSATGVFEFLTNFEEFITSKAQIKLNFNFDNFVGLFLVQALGFNTFFESFKSLKINKNFYLI